MKQILVADDRPTSRELTRTVLEQSGYRVIEVSDGVKAIETARQTLPDLIILDLSHCVRDGGLVIRKFRQDQRLAGAPIMALTADALKGDREAALEAGFTSYLAKPIRLDALRSEVARLLSNSRTTECDATQFLTQPVVHVAPCSLLTNSRTTEACPLLSGN